MSAWTDFRNAVEAILQPEVAAAASFGDAVLNDTEAAGSGNITSAFAAAVAAFTAGSTLEERVFAAGAAFVTTLLGYEVNIVRADASAAASTPPSV